MVLRAGPLDMRIALQRKSMSYSPSGSPVETWLALAERWSALKPLSGAERNAASQWIAREQTEFTIRWSPEVADLTPLDRVVCPASDAGASPLSARSIYDIMAVHEVERNETMVIMAARRVA